MATSKLVYNPDIGDDGRYLACRVLPTTKAGKSLEDTWEIKVLCESQWQRIISQNHKELFLKITQNYFSKAIRITMILWAQKIRICLQTSLKSLCGWAPPWTLTICGQVDHHNDRHHHHKEKFVCLSVSFWIWPFKANDVLCIRERLLLLLLSLLLSLLCSGNDVYFECDVRANPVPHKLIWLHNVSAKLWFHVSICVFIFSISVFQDVV